MRPRILVFGSPAVLVAAAGLRRLGQRSGVDAAHLALALPGDELVPDATAVIDRACILPAPPEWVWPWIVQLGKGRAGWYFPRWLDPVTPSGRRGLRHIDAHLQSVAVADEHADWGPGTPVLRVSTIEPERALVYLSLRDRDVGHRWPPDGRADRPGVFAMSWALVLTDLGGSTRLHLRLRIRAKSAVLATVGGLFDWATVALLFAGLRERLGS